MIIVALIGFTAYGTLKLFSVADADRASKIRLIVGFIVGFVCFLAFFPPWKSCHLRTDNRYRDKIPFSASGHHFRAGDVLVFKREWKNVDYRPETEEEFQRMGVSIIGLSTS